MSLIKANAVQVGQSPTATQNFTLAVPSSPDGTIKLARGNSGATTQDVMNVSNAGVVSFPQGLGNISNSTAIATGSTTARSLANRFADVVNVLDFGAFKDGTNITQTTSAFNNATAISSKVFAPEGNYLVSTLPDTSKVFGNGFYLLGSNLIPCGDINQNLTITIGTDFSTLQDAISYLQQRNITANSIVTISLPSGIVNSNLISFQHPNGECIQIIGTTPSSTTISSVGSISGSVGAYSIPVTVANSTNFSIGKYVLIKNTSGTGAHKSLQGIWEITNVSGSIVTIKNTCRLASFPTFTLSSGNISCLQTVYSFTGQDGFRISSNLKKIDNIAIVGNSASGTNGIVMGRVGIDSISSISSNIGTSVGVNGFDANINSQYNSNIYADNVCSCNARTYNFLSQHCGSMYTNSCISNGSILYGFGATNSGDILMASPISYCNGDISIWAYAGGSMLITNCDSSYNNGDGMRSSFGGAIRCQTTSLFTYNVQNGVTAQSGDVYLSGITCSNNSINGIDSQDGGRIYVISTPTSTITSNTANQVASRRRGFVNISGNSITGNLYAGQGGWIEAIGATGVITYNPAANTLGNEEGYINT